MIMSSIVTMARPNSTPAQVFNLVKEKYGLIVDSCKPLVSYDDQNYRIKVREEYENKFIEKLHPHGYVLKILNSLDSQNVAKIEAQNEIMFHLDRNDFKVPTPERNVFGDYYSLESFGKEGPIHIVRLLKYQVGTMLDDAEPNHELYFNLGTLVAKVDICLSTFYHPGTEHDSIWLLKNAPMLMRHIEVVKDPNRRKIVEQHVEDFTNHVLAEFDNLEKGVIHGDINEYNVLVIGNEMSALLDFGDCNYSAFVLEAASAICYILIHSGDISYGKSFLDGYNTIRKMPDPEIKLLRTCVCARLCQSLVLGAQSALNDPTNEYILSTQKRGWPLLEQLSAITNDELISRWN